MSLPNDVPTGWICRVHGVPLQGPDDECALCEEEEMEEEAEIYHDVKEWNLLLSENANLLAENGRLRKYLEEIAKGKGPYSQDRSQHCANVVEAMKGLATKALAGQPFEEE